MDKAIIYGPGMRMAVVGELLAMSLGIPDGFRGRAAKYGSAPDPNDELIACGVEDWIASRPEETGNTVESVCAYRDKMIIGILRLQELL
jgi:carnitine 3-dehydrogenase